VELRLAFLFNERLLFAKAVLAQGKFFAAGATIENEINDLYRSGLLAGPLNGYCERISPLESGLLQPQTVGNVDTEEMDWGSELRQILVSSPNRVRREKVMVHSGR
jgi:hypothetical protein